VASHGNVTEASNAKRASLIPPTQHFQQPVICDSGNEVVGNIIYAWNGGTCSALRGTAINETLFISVEARRQSRGNFEVRKTVLFGLIRTKEL